MGRTCAICGIPIRQWELCCAACTAGLAPDDPEFILVHSPSLLSRSVDAGALSLAAVCTGLAAMLGAGFIVTNVILPDLHGALRTIAALVLLLGTLIVLLLCVALFEVAKDRFTSNAAVWFTRSKISYHGVRENEDAPPTFTDLEVEIPANGKVTVSQGFFGRLLGFGSVQIKAVEPWSLRGARDPQAFAERIAWLIAQIGRPAEPSAAARVARLRASEAARRAALPSERYGPSKFEAIVAMLWRRYPLVAMPLALIMTNFISFVFGLAAVFAINFIPGDFQGAGVFFGSVLNGLSAGILYIGLAAEGFRPLLGKPNWIKILMVLIPTALLNCALLSLSLFALDGIVSLSVGFAILVAVAASVIGAAVMAKENI